MEQRLGGTVLGTTVAKIDFVNDTTVVEVRWSARAPVGSARSLDTTGTA